MDYVEQTSPRGVTLKVMPQKWTFLAFGKGGSAIFADGAGAKALHRVQLVVFVGYSFGIKNTATHEFSFLKVIKNQIIIPYTNEADGGRNYVFIDTTARFDLMPVRLKALGDIAMLVREIEGGLRPDYIVVDKNITKNDIIIIKNRMAGAHIILAENNAARTPVNPAESGATQYADGRASDVLKEVNINMMSNNPVFLARVHLREMDIAKVNQLILDFDLSEIEASYILSFIATMLAKAADDQEIMKNKGKLEILRDSLEFYIALLNREDDAVRALISSLKDDSNLSSYFTFIAKVKLLYPGTEDQLIFTDYENLLWEKKDSFRDSNFPQ